MLLYDTDEANADWRVKTTVVICYSTIMSSGSSSNH